MIGVSIDLTSTLEFGTCENSIPFKRLRLAEASLTPRVQALSSEPAVPRLRFHRS